METLANQKKYGSIEDWNSKSPNWDKVYVFVLNHDVKDPSMAGTHFPNSYSMALEDQIFDTKTGKSRVIRVVKGELSIFKDEQTEDGQTRRYENKMFNKKGAMVVDAREEQVLKFMMLTNKNGSNPNRDKSTVPLFYLFNPRQGVDADITNYKAEAEAVNWCYSDSTQFKHLIRYARVLGINTNEDADLIKHQMAQLAKKDPIKFLEGLKNKYTIRKFYVLEAIDKGIVAVDLRSNTLAWSNGHIITASPVGRNPVDHFVDISVSDATFDMTYTTIKEQVEPTTEKLAPKEEVKYQAKTESIIEKVEDKLSDTQNTLDVNISPEDLIAKAKRAGIIAQKGSWFFYLDKKYQGNKMKEAIVADAVLKEDIIRAVNEVK